MASQPAWLGDCWGANEATVILVKQSGLVWEHASRDSSIDHFDHTKYDPSELCDPYHVWSDHIERSVAILAHPEPALPQSGLRISLNLIDLLDFGATCT